MKRIRAAIITFALLLAFTGGVFFFFYTTSGVHFLFGTISRLTPAKISAAGVRGCLAGQVSITKLLIRLPETSIDAEKVIISYLPYGLLFGRLDFRKLCGEDFKLLRTGPQKKDPISFIPPPVPRIVAALSVRIGEFTIDKLSYGRPSENLTFLNRVSGRAEWYRGKLSLQDLLVLAPAGQIAGKLEVGFYRPLLRSELWIDTRQRWAGLNRLLVRSNLKPSLAADVMTGTVNAWAYQDNEGLMALEANLSALKRALNIRNLKIMRVGRRGIIRISGWVATDKAVPSFAISAEMDQFPLIGSVPGDWKLSGNVNTAGTADAYKGTFVFSNKANDWRAFRIDGRLRGDGRQIVTEISRGQWLNGISKGAVTVNWEKNLEIIGNLNARGLDTALIDETWQGVINSDATFRLYRSPSGISAATLKARLLDSSFRQRAVRGVIDAVYEKGDLRIEELALKGKGFDISGKGSLANRINFDANLRDLSSLIPGARGMFSGQGSIRYVKDGLTMNLSANGRAIQHHAVGIGHMEVAAHLDQTGAENVRMEARAQSISYKGIDLRSFRAMVKGKISAHEALLMSESSGTQMQGALNGSYEKGIWKCFLKELKGSDKQRGAWNLERPVSLILSKKHIHVDPLVLVGDKGESIAGAIDLHLKPVRGFIRAEWQNVDLSRLDPITAVSLHIRSKGHVLLEWAKGALNRFDGEAISGGGRLIFRQSPVSVSYLATTVDWTSKGLKATGQVSFAEGGSFQADISSPLRPMIGLPEEARFSTAWQGFRLSALNPFMSDVSHLEGTASGQAKGKLLPNQAFTVDAFNSQIVRAVVTQKREGAIVQVNIPDAWAQGSWTERNINGRVHIDGGATGGLNADFVLPIPARLPLRTVASGPVKLNAKASIRDMKLITILLPEPVQRPEGHLELVASAAGTWGRPTLNGQLCLQNGGFHIPGPDIRVRRARVEGNLSWNGQGLSARLDGRLNEGGVIQASALSPATPRMGLPETVNLSVRWSDFNLGLIKPALPAKLSLTGRMAGSFEGSLFPGRRIVAAMETNVSQGDFTWRTDRGLARAALRKAFLKAKWSGEDLRGQMSLELAKQGQLQGSFLLPIPARLPVHTVRSGPLTVKLEGRMQEEGILSSFFPGLVQEVKGTMAMNAQVIGTWDQPRFAGTARLSEAGAYLPTAGITIRAVSANIVFLENNVIIEEFQAESGPGRINGSGTISLKNGRIETFKGRLSGDRFQALYLPDLRLRVSPSLNIRGTGKTVFIEGDVHLPQLLVYGPPTENVVRSSPDVVIIGGREKEKRRLPIEMQAKVRVVLGEDVRLRMQGIDAGLEGSVLLDIKGVEDIDGAGEIRIAKGQYRAYGVELQVARGRMVFAGPIERGRLDILAVRKIEGVVRSTRISERLVGSATAKARTTGVPAGVATSTSTETQTVGVQVAGVVQRPRISLYSNPPLSDSDTLSYMVLGRPVSGDAAQASLLFGAAGSLLGGGTGGSVQEQLKSILGLETLEIGTERVATDQGQIEQTMVRVGRYLAPNLYVGFGRSLFGDQYVITARYSLSKRWEIQTRTGTQTGGDIFYRVEFD